MGRRRVNITHETERKAADLLLALIPKDGRSIGNTKLSEGFLEQSRKQLNENFGAEVYWQVRNGLIELGKLERGRGKGGSVRLVGDAVRLPKQKRKYRKESHLYESFHKTIETQWIEEYDITDYVSEISAHKGRRSTGGKWTRPDVTLVSVGNYPFIPGKSVEVITFEIKPSDAYGVEGVYETASHSAFANKSYLALHVPGGTEQEAEGYLERLEKEAVRFRVGLVTFEDPSKWDTFDVRVEAQHQTPSPRDANEFLSRLRGDVKEKLQKLLK